MNHKPKVLFFSTGNATRSRMAAAFLRRKLGREVVEEASTAVNSPEASPLTQEGMQEVGVDISPCQAKEIKESFREHFAFVVTMSTTRRNAVPSGRSRKISSTGICPTPRVSMARPNAKKRCSAASATKSLAA